MWVVQDGELHVSIARVWTFLGVVVSAAFEDEVCVCVHGRIVADWMGFSRLNNCEGNAEGDWVLGTSEGYI